MVALGAPAEMMLHFDKAIVGADKWLMQLGTLSGNPVASVVASKQWRFCVGQANMKNCARSENACKLCSLTI